MINATNNKNQSVKCIHCRSTNHCKKGFRKTENRGEIQKYFCRDCGRFFTNDDGFYRMRNNEKKITAGIDLYYKGVSLRKVRDHFEAFYPHNASHMSVYRWIIKYALMVSKTTDNLPIQSGREMMSDEMEYHRRINRNQKGIEQNWFVDTFDVKTRFMVTGDYMRSRTIENLVGVLRRSKFKVGNRVTIVTTDGLQGYPRVLRKTFGVDKNYGFGFHKTTKSNVIHNIVIADERGFNHPIERLHNTIRERTKIMRGFHGSIESARAVMKGLEINYNFNRKNMALKGKMPYEVAIPELTLGNNKWLDLIRLSKI